MKKLFTLAAVLVAALAMNAAVVYDWAGKVGSQSVTSPDDKITFETGKYNKNATEVDCIKIGSSYKSEIKDGAGNPVLDGEGNKTYKYNYLTIQPAEGGFKKGDVLKFKAFYSHNDAKNVKVWVLDANDTELYLSENVIDGKTQEGDVPEASFTLTEDIASLRVARNGNSTLFIMSLVVERGTTAIDNTEIDAKVVKTFENGQLVIIKNGVKYNATGAIIK